MYVYGSRARKKERRGGYLGKDEGWKDE